MYILFLVYSSKCSTNNNKKKSTWKVAHLNFLNCIFINVIKCKIEIWKKIGIRSMFASTLWRKICFNRMVFVLSQTMPSYWVLFLFFLCYFYCYLINWLRFEMCPHLVGQSYQTHSCTIRIILNMFNEFCLLLNKLLVFLFLHLIF